MMTRRGFFGLLVGAIAGRKLLPVAPASLVLQSGNTVAIPGVYAVNTWEETGITIRMIRQYDAREDRWITRTDAAYGWPPQFPEVLPDVKILGSALEYEDDDWEEEDAA